MALGEGSGLRGGVGEGFGEGSVARMWGKVSRPGGHKQRRGLCYIGTKVCVVEGHAV